jgi:hypothetical protein
MKVIITESQLKDIIKSNFGLDLTGQIRMVTNKWELPFEFDKVIGERMLNHYLNKFGPMYVFDTKKGLFLAQDRGKQYNGWNIADKFDFGLSELDFMKILGIEYLGLSIDDLLNEYFDEKSINEEVTDDLDEPDDNITKIIQAYLDMNLPNYYNIKRFWVDYNEQFDDYIVNIFFDRQLAIEMGGGMNKLIRKATDEIGNELIPFFKGINLVFHQHFE